MPIRNTWSRRAMPAIVVVLGLSAGCARPRAGIIGRWHGATVSSPRSSVTTDAEFKPDGMVTFTVRYARATLAASGRYAKTGDTLRYTPQGGTLNGRPLPTAQGRAFTTETYHVTLAGDNLTLAPTDGPRIVLTRVR